jgi:RHS repeat-associated protein
MGSHEAQARWYWTSMVNYQFIRNYTSSAFEGCTQARDWFYPSYTILLQAYYGFSGSGQATVLHCHWRHSSIASFTSITSATIECNAGQRVNAFSPDGCVPIEPVEDNRAGVCNTVGNPINLIAGNKTAVVADFQAIYPSRLSFVRYYNSIGEAVARLGAGWRSNLDRQLLTSGGPNVTGVRVVRPNGIAVGYQKTGSIWRPTYWAGSYFNYPRTDLRWSLTFDGSIFTFTDEDDTTETYNVSGRLLTIKERDGYQLTFTYDAAGNNTVVSDSFGGQLTFTYYSNGRLQTMATPDGKVYTYSYLYRDVPLGQTQDANGLGGVWVLDKVIEPDETPSNPTDNLYVQYHYEDANHLYALTGTTGQNGVRYATWTYDSSRRVVSSKHAGDVDQTLISYDDVNKTRTVTNPLGKLTLYQLELFQGSLRVKQVQGQASANCPLSNSVLTYDANGFLGSITDQEGRITNFTNNTRGLPTTIVRGFGTPQATTTTIAYHATLSVPTQIIEPGLTTTLTWDANGRLTQLSKADTTTHTVPYSTNGQTRTWAYGYGTGGTLTSVDGPLPGAGDTVSYAYSANGHLTSVTNELGHVTQITAVNGRGQPTSMTDPNGSVTNLDYDSQGRLTTMTVNPGTGQAVTSIQYDAIGQITRVTRPDGSYFTYTYDDARRLTAVEQSNGERIEYGRDPMGNMTSKVIRRADTSIAFNQTQTFDELGRLLRHIGAYSQTTLFGYDKTDNLTSATDPRSKVYVSAFDSVNRLIRETDPEMSQVNYTLDARGVTTAYTDPRGLATTYVYNGFRELIQEVSQDRGTIVYVRDARGLVTQMTDGRGVSTNMTYDNGGRLLTKTYPAAPAESIAHTYDSVASGNKGVGRLTKIEDESGSTELVYDGRGNVITEVRTIAGQAHTIAYAYDLVDRVEQITYPSGRIVDYSRDSQGRVTSVTTRTNAGAAPVVVASSIAYQPLSNLVKSFDYGNGLSELNTHTLDYELNELSVYDGASAIISRSHARADNLNLTGIADAVVPGNSQTFAMSDANRLHAAAGPWGEKTLSYDGVGNRTGESTTISGSTVTDAYDYPGTSNRLVAVTRGAMTVRAFSYDGAGNILSDSRVATSYAYTYNNRNRLATVTVGGSLRGTYAYNGLEQLAIRVMTDQSPSGTVHSLYDRAGNLIAETDGTGSGGTVREYIWLPEAEIAPTSGSRTAVARPMAVVSDVSTSPTLSWVHVDHLHRPIRITSAAKLQVWEAVWQPWGEAHSINGSVALDLRLPGQWFQIEAGLHYNWHRHYDPSIGRYTQPDPLGFVDGPSVYGYAKGAPLILVDPEGHFSNPIPWIPPSLPIPLPLPPPEALPSPGPSPGGEWTMPPIRDPKEPRGRGCSCRCRATDRAAQQSYFAEAEAPDCKAATKSACQEARRNCKIGEGDVHHQQAKCSDGTVRNGGGGVLGRFRYDG